MTLICCTLKMCMHTDSPDGPCLKAISSGRGFGLLAFQLPCSCLQLSELHEATLSKKIQAPQPRRGLKTPCEAPLVLLSQLLPAAGRGPSWPLASGLEGLLERLVGPDSVLSRLMAGASRAHVDVVEAYNLEGLAPLGFIKPYNILQYYITHTHIYIYTSSES